MEQLFKVRKNRLDLFKKRRTLPVREPLEAPDNLYKSCPQCKESILFEDLMHNLYVCPHCGHHMKLTARDLKTLGVVDEVIPEPPEGAHACPEAAFAAVDRALSLGLEQVLREGDFAQKRYEKFRGMGAPRSRREAP